MPEPRPNTPEHTRPEHTESTPVMATMFEKTVRLSALKQQTTIRQQWMGEDISTTMNKSGYFDNNEQAKTIWQLWMGEANSTTMIGIYRNTAEQQSQTLNRTERPSLNVQILRQRKWLSAKGDGRPQEFNNYGVIKFKTVRSWWLLVPLKVSCKRFSLATPHSISVGAAFFCFPRAIALSLRNCEPLPRRRREPF